MVSKQTLGFAVVAIGVVAGWIALRSYLIAVYPDLTKPPSTPPTPPAATQVSKPLPAPVAAPTAQPAAVQGAAAVEAPVGPAAATATTPAVSAGWTVKQADVARGATLGSTAEKDATFALALDLSPRGAGVNQVTVNEYRQPVTRTGVYTFQNRIFASPESGSAIVPVTPLIDADASRSLAVLSVKINGQPVTVASAFWTLVSSTDRSATFSLPITSGKSDVVELVRTYTLKPKADPTAGYEVENTLAVRNLTPNATTVEVVMNGPAAPPYEIERGPERQAVAGYLNRDGVAVNVNPTMIESLTDKKPVADITHMSGNSQPIMWFGANGAYFNAFLRPETLDGKLGVPDYIEKVEAVLADASDDAHRRHFVTRLTTRVLTIGAGQSVTLPFKAYFGPKLRGVVDNEYYSKLPFNYDSTLVITGGLCGFCTFQPVIRVLVFLLRMFHSVTLDWGVSIIVLVLFVRLLLHPITRRAQFNLMKMAKLGPELERIKKKHGDDKEAMQKAVAQFYSENGATQIFGCLPMLLQTPIWIALYASLQSTFELRQSPFFYGFTWIKDLAQPDHLLSFQTVTIFGWFPISGLNLLPFALAVVFWLQQKLQPKPPATTPEQEQQQKMMQWMTLLFPVFLYNGPSGLNIYILASTTFGILESRHIRKIAKLREDALAEGKIVDSGREFTPATVISRSGADGSGASSAKPGAIGGWMARMQAKMQEAQKMADEMKRQQAKAKKK